MESFTLQVHEEARIDGPLEQLIKVKSTESHIRKFTPRDELDRFGSLEKIQSWFAKGRVLYSFWHSEDLAGVAWFSKQQVFGGLIIPPTFAIRLYNGYAGRGLATQIMNDSHERYFAAYPADAVYLETDLKNVAARRLYEKFGYKVMALQGERLTMLYDRGVYEEQL